MYQACIQKSAIKGIAVFGGLGAEPPALEKIYVYFQK